MKQSPFIFDKEIREILRTGWESGQNVLLYGPPGYGKSAMSKFFCERLLSPEETLSIKSMGIGTTTNDLFGGINMKTLKETGFPEYLVDYSVYNSHISIWEEGFDMPKRVLESQKDVLTSGVIRNGSQQWPIKTRMVVVCTNRTKEELIEDDSTKAIMERFPLTLEVVWQTHTLSDYRDMLKTVFGNNEDIDTTHKVLEYLLDSYSESNIDPIPPRTVIRMHKIIRASGLQSLRFIDVPYIERAVAHIEKERHNERSLSQMKSIIDEIIKLKKEVQYSEGGYLDKPHRFIREYNQSITQKLNKFSDNLWRELFRWSLESLLKEYRL